jgi:hypothetical protein
MASEPDVGGLVVDGELGGYVPVLGGGELSRALTHVSRVSPRRCLAGLAASLWWSRGRVWGRAHAGRGCPESQPPYAGAPWERDSLVGPLCFPLVRVCALYSWVVLDGATL